MTSFVKNCEFNFLDLHTENGSPGSRWNRGGPHSRSVMSCIGMTFRYPRRLLLVNDFLRWSPRTPTTGYFLATLQVAETISSAPLFISGRELFAPEFGAPYAPPPIHRPSGE